MNVLSVEALDSNHGLLKAVRGVSFTVAEGEILALVGANGAGKTTLLRTIAGAHKPSSGKIVFEGIDVTNVPAGKRTRAGIALVPEGRRIFGEMTVEENLLVAGRTGRKGRWNYATVLEAFPMLRRIAQRKGGDLSGGEQQATAIGRALMTNPRLLLIDELSLGLSPVAVNAVYESLESVMASGATIVLVEQDLSRVLRVSTRVACMLEGRIVREGRTSEITKEAITEAYFGLRRGEEVKA
ncbi:MAG TPA: ABC transporter ATP-binding protein [Candidatus Baltobacteraceae bacterium]|nr:ABC transporter ATP-binding protein [Candidatus Baltobacteraceae bacterium]